MKQRWMAYPYIAWMILFIIVPLALVVFYSVTVQTEDGIRFTMENFRRCLDPIYIKVLIRSVILALISTGVCLLLGYPVAWILSGKEYSRKKILYLLIVLPMWMNFLLRTYSWMTLLERNGVINSLLTGLHLPPFHILYTDGAVVLGMVYNFLPFMILPIYSVLSKLDGSMIEAAQDLGGDAFTVFRRIILPLSLPGVASGITMVFMPAVSTFVISRLLGGGQFMLIGNLIEQQFLSSGDWGFGSALSVLMMLLILLSMGIMQRHEPEREGGMLW